MISFILEQLFNFVVAVIQAGGYFGVFVLMALESVNIPIPSEVIMPFSGYLAEQGIFSFWFAVLMGALGNLFGSLLSYFLALWFLKNGFQNKNRWLAVLINQHSLETGEGWFQKYGEASIFLSRLLPVIRTFISFPAGLAKMDLLKFSVFTLAGSFIWSAALAWLGFALAENWSIIHIYFQKLDWLILFLMAVAVGWLIWRHFSNGKVDIREIKS